tara:strand:+ start:253 stop:702 length:450 start_codon:yes stop_codon:yes gene_type:complete
MNKKATAGAWMSVGFLMLGMVLIILFVSLFVKPLLGGKKENEIKVSLQEETQELVLHGLLRQEYQGSTLLERFLEENYKSKKSEIQKGFEEGLGQLTLEPRFIVLVDDQSFITSCSTKCVKSRLFGDYTVILPQHLSDPLKVTLRRYYP